MLGYLYFVYFVIWFLDVEFLKLTIFLILLDSIKDFLILFEINPKTTSSFTNPIDYMKCFQIIILLKTFQSLAKSYL